MKRFAADRGWESMNNADVLQLGLIVLRCLCDAALGCREASHFRAHDS
jgi:hypothetical protein